MDFMKRFLRDDNIEYWQPGVFENVPGGIGVFQWKEQVLELIALNGQLRKTLGVSEEDIRTKSRQEILELHPEDRERVYGMFEDSIRNREGFLEITARYRNHESKEYIWMRVSYSADYEVNGNMLCYATYRDITAEKELEKQLQTNVLSMRTALDHCGIYHALYDIKNKKVLYGSKLQREFGMPEFEQQGEVRNRGLLTTEGRTELLRIAEEMRSGKRDFAMAEIEVRRPDVGEWIWTKQSYTVLEKDENGLPLTVVSTAQDITKEKEDEKRFSEDNMYHHMLYDNMTSVIRMNITDWRVLDFTGEYVLLHSESESPFQTMAKHIKDEEQRKEFESVFSRANLMQQFAQDNRKITYTYRSHRLSGKILWMKTTVEMTAREGEDIIGLIACQDVDREVLGDNLQTSVVNSLVDFVAYVNIDADDSQVYAENPEYQVEEAFTGMGIIKQLQSQLEGMIVPEERERASEQFEWKNILKRVKNGGRWDYVYHSRDKNTGIRTKTIHAELMRMDWNVVMVVQRDITDITAEQEAQKAELQNALAIANRASHVREEFLSSMSHDMRTPLNGIIGAAELARNMKDRLPEEVQEYLKDIMSSGKFMLSLVNNILDTNRMAQGKMSLNIQKINFSDIMQDIYGLFVTDCEEKKIRLLLEAGEQIREVYADPVRLQRIFTNLISNAIKFTPPGGTVELRAQERERIGERYLVSVSVKDSGAGMSEEFQEHMYDIFTQEHNEINTSIIGTGLGLSIVKNLVELMDGEIQCKSKPGEGTEFTVILPFKLAEDSESDSAEKRFSKKQLKEGHLKEGILREEILREEVLWDRKVLLAEDNDLNAKIVIRLLESKQIQVKWVKNGKELLQHFRMTEPYTYDAILMDIQMPVMDGIQACKEVRAMERADARLVPIFALTANVFDADVQKSKEAGMNAHLIKPLEPKKLFVTLMNFWGVQE
ncbi:MAG: response regulator [Lachnospiraceae bacterium]|nr:response regulator [Lachnospiraceae bacterium]